MSEGAVISEDTGWKLKKVVAPVHHLGGLAAEIEDMGAGMVRGAEWDRLRAIVDAAGIVAQVQRDAHGAVLPRVYLGTGVFFLRVHWTTLDANRVVKLAARYERGGRAR